MEIALLHVMLQKVLYKYKCFVKMVNRIHLKGAGESNALARFLVLFKYLRSTCDLHKKSPNVIFFVYSYTCRYCTYPYAQAWFFRPVFHSASHFFCF